MFFGDSDRPCMEDVSELKYLEYCFKETWRIYPSVPCIMRRLIIDIKIGKFYRRKYQRGCQFKTKSNYNTGGNDRGIRASG